MIHLTEEEQEILDGKQGKLRQTALENIVQYARVLGAEKLCKVTKATVFCGSHTYLGVCKSKDFHEVFSRMNLARDEWLPATSLIMKSSTSPKRILIRTVTIWRRPEKQELP